MKIWFVINSLGGGGAERLLQTLSSCFCKDGHEVIILTLQPPDAAYEFPPGVKVVPLISRVLGFSRLSRALSLPFLALELAIRLRIHKPDGWLSLMYLANFAAILTRAWGYKGRIVISEHIDLRAYIPESTIKGQIMKGLCQFLYPKASSILAVSNGVAESLYRLGISPSKVAKIPNSIDSTWIRHEARRSLQPKFDQFTFVTAGRLCEQKDQRTAIRAFAAIPGEDSQLLILGEGPLRAQLTQEILELGLSHRVHLLGWHPNPFEVMARCHAFILSSSSEGFGLVLAEAMALGLPTISTDCQSGPAEILGQGDFGKLVPVGDEAALTAAMTEFKNDQNLKERWEGKVLRRAQEYDISNVFRSYLDLLTADELSSRFP